MRAKVIITPRDDGDGPYFAATLLALGIEATGTTREEALEHLRTAARHCLANGVEAPDQEVAELELDPPAAVARPAVRPIPRQQPAPKPAAQEAAPEEPPPMAQI